MKTVLITGASGVVGSALVPHFLDEPETRVVLLLRAESAERLRQRSDSLFEFWKISPGDPRAARVEALRGDVSVPRLGLNEANYRAVAARVTHVVHSAGNVKLNQSLAEARRDNLDALRHVLGLARDCGRFAKLDHVSTVGVAGRARGLVPEAPLTGSRAFHNAYEEAKAEAESLLFDEVRAGLPATVHRPSMVVGDSRTGAVLRFQVFYHLSRFLAGMNTWGVVPDTGGYQLDLIPVDYVARMIHLANGSPETAGRVFHLASGPDLAPRLSDLRDRLRSYFRDKGERLPRLRILGRGWVRALLPLFGWMAPAKARRAFQGLHLFLDYLDEEQTFANGKARAFAAERGLVVPPIEDYFRNVMKYWWDRKTV